MTKEYLGDDWDFYEFLLGGHVEDESFANFLYKPYRS